MSIISHYPVYVTIFKNQVSINEFQVQKNIEYNKVSKFELEKFEKKYVNKSVKYILRMKQYYKGMFYHQYLEGAKKVTCTGCWQKSQ